LPPQNSSKYSIERKELTSIADFVSLLCRLSLSIDAGCKNPAIDIRESELDWVLHFRLGRQIKMRVQDTETNPPGEKPPGGSGSHTERQTPEVGHLQVGREVTQGAEPPQVGNLQVGRQAMLDNRIAEMGHLQVGRKAQAELEALEHLIKT
jgi:hypothetical protein